MQSLIKALDAQLIEADSTTTEAGSQRQVNHERYSMQPLGNEMKGRSHYIDPSVMDVVESKKAFFRETFFSGRKVVKFRPTENESAQQADSKTAYVERQLKANDWYKIFRDCLHDAFVAKRCVLHVEWTNDEDVTMLSVAQATPEQLQWQLSYHPETIDIDAEAMEQNPDGTITGTLRLISDSSKVKLRLIRPESYYRDPEADYPEDSAYLAFDEIVTRGSLLKEGFDPDQINKLSADSKHRSSEEDSSRNRHSGAYTSTRKHNREGSQETLNTKWSYSWMNMSEHVEDYPDEVRLYKVRWCDSEVLRYEDGRHAIEEVSEMPFFEWEQYKIAHASSGMCDADVVGPVQKQLSNFKRLVIDNQQMANTSRYSVLVNGVKDIKPLTDTTIGGVVPVLRQDAITPLPAPQLSPATMPAVEMLEADKEARSGNTRLAKGMNKDAMSEQNASSMIERLTNSANKRIAGEARDFAETFLVPLMRYIYCLGVRHDKETYQLEVGGQQTQASPQEWAEPAPHADVAVALTPDEGTKQAMALAQMHQMLAQDPVAGQLYGVSQRHALFDQMFDLLGVDDASRFMMTPGSEEFMQSMQQQQQQLMMQQQQIQQQQMLQQQLMQSADQREWERVKMDNSKTQMELMDTAADNSREDERLSHTKVYDFAKLGVERDKNAQSS